MTIVEEPTSPVTASVLGRVLLELDPRQLLDNPLNPRSELGDVSAEAASMRECGVLEPLIVVPAPGNRFMILFGHRRRAAAIEAGLATVPCDVRPEYADLEPEQLADMLAENLHRQDLTALDEAGGYAQLAMFDGWNPERIAKRLGRAVDRVRAGIAASEIRPELRPQVVDGAVTLEQAAAIEESRLTRRRTGHPKEWGHGVPGHYRHQSSAEIRAQEEAAQAEREHQTALQVADEARASFLIEYLSRKGRPPAGTLRTALTILCRFDTGAEPRVGAACLLHPAGLDGDPRDSRPAEAALVEAVTRSADNRLPYLALAYAAAAGERNLRRRGGWSFSPAFALHWLDVIAELGYPLTDAELTLREHVIEQLAEIDADEADSADGDEDAADEDGADVEARG